jgi:hypothetical protein
MVGCCGGAVGELKIQVEDSILVAHSLAEERLVEDSHLAAGSPERVAWRLYCGERSMKELKNKKKHARCDKGGTKKKVAKDEKK